MHEEILSKRQLELLPLVGKFSSQFGLVGGTAISLQLGHRRSIDFDLVTLNPLNHEGIRKVIRESYRIENTLVENPEELTIVAAGVKLTFLKYPFRIVFSESFEQIIKMSDLLTLASMKAFALGRRAKWKDYVDLFFIFEKKPFLDVVEKTKEIFGQEFNEKLFREQLSYFRDIDYSETIDYLPGFEKQDSFIKDRLMDISLQKS